MECMHGGGQKECRWANSEKRAKLLLYLFALVPSDGAIINPFNEQYALPSTVSMIDGVYRFTLAYKKTRKLYKIVGCLKGLHI